MLLFVFVLSLTYRPFKLPVSTCIYINTWASLLVITSHPVTVCQTTSRLGLTNLIPFPSGWFLHAFTPSDKITRHWSCGDTWWKLGHHAPERLGIWGWNYQYLHLTLSLMENLHKLIKIQPRICRSHDATPVSFYSTFDISATETKWQLLQAPKNA